MRKIEKGVSSSESPGQAFQKVSPSISPPVFHKCSLLRVTVLNFYDSCCLVPLTDTDCLFSLFDPRCHTQSNTDCGSSFTGLWEENVFLFERNQTTAGAQVSGDLHWSDTNPGHDSHHYSALGSLLWSKGAWDRPNDVPEEWHDSASVMSLSWTVETKPVEDLWTHIYGKQLYYTLRDGRIIENVKEGNYKFILLDLCIFEHTLNHFRNLWK